MPALLTRMSMPPWRATIPSTTRVQSSGLETSSRASSTLPRKPGASGGVMSPAIVVAPSAAKSSATASPMPRAPPVTRATLPRSLSISSSPSPDRRPAVSLRGSCLPAARPVRRHRKNDDRPLHHELKLNGEAEEQHDVEDHGQEQRAQQAAEHAAPAAGQCDPAHHRGDDRVELIAPADPVVDAVDVTDQDQAADAGQDRAADVAGDGHAIDIHADQLGGPGVATHHIHPPAERGPAEQEPNRAGEHQEE